MIAPLLLALVALTPSFDEWAAENGRTYSPAEVSHRREVYSQNLVKITTHNLSNATWKMGVNKFADLTAAEFAGLYTGGFRPATTVAPKRTNLRIASMALPASVDWTTKGAVTPVKDQGQCGSCWAFSTTGSTEGAWFQKNGTLVSLSEEQLVECSDAEGNQGCNGGLMDYGFQYIIDNKGITTEAAYPYTSGGGTSGTCQAKGKPVAATLSGFTDVPVNSETALLTAIVQQPVSVAVEADQDTFQFYTSGVMTGVCGTQLDHGVLAVGYGTDATGGDYYKVKNSWGASWGEAGYIRLGRGAKFNPSGQCGIQMVASYPVV